MTSKSSFLVSMMENNKRRLWVWILSALAFMLALPAFLALTINGVVRRTEWITENYGEAAAWSIIHEKLIDTTCRVLGLNIAMLLLAAAIALVSAVQGFSYLYSRKKIDFYMGMPVKRKKRFLVVWLNGILLYVLPYLAGLLLSMLIAAGNGAMDKTVLISAACALLINCCVYLGVYHMAVLAVMLTGNIVITGFAFLVFSLYEFVVRAVVEGYKQLFFRYFADFGSDRTPMLSPYSMYRHLSDQYEYANRIDGKYLLALLVFAAVLGALSYICYLKRPAEAAGKAMAFEITRPIVKILLVIPVSLLMGGIISEAAGFSPEESMDGIGWMIFAMALTVLIGSAVIQVIYEFDIKGALHKKRHIVVSGILVTLIFLVFRYDLFGYDDYIPKPEQVESIAFIPMNYNESAYGRAYFDGNGYAMSQEEYASRYMYLTNIEEICGLADTSMREYNKIDRYRNTEAGAYDTQQYWSYATIVYRLKSGREVARCLWVDVEDDKTTEILDHIIGSWEFKRGFMMGASDALGAMLANKEGRYKINAGYGNMVYREKMSSAEADEFLEIYLRDLALADFSNMKENAVVGVVNIGVREEISGSAYMGANGIMSRYTRGWDFNLNIYPFYEESIAWLKAHGYYRERQAEPEDIARIQVVNHNEEAARALREKQLTDAGAQALVSEPAALPEYGAAQTAYGDSDTRVYVDYTEEDKLKKIAEAVYTNELGMGSWDHGKALDRDYEVIVYFKTDSEMTRNFGTCAYYGFLEGEVPDFVREDTLYRESKIP